MNYRTLQGREHMAKMNLWTAEEILKRELKAGYTKSIEDQIERVRLMKELLLDIIIEKYHKKL